MQIPKEGFAKGVELCFSNATRLMDDAVLLLKSGSYGHALFLVISAIEEISKAFMYSCGRVEIWKEKELGADVVKHLQKYAIFVLAIFEDAFADGYNKAVQTKGYKMTKPLELNDLKELGKEFESVVNEIWKSRLQSLYVDYRQGMWLSPFDITRKEVTDILQYAKKYKKTLELLCTNILKAPIDQAKQIQEFLERQLFPAILDQIQKNAKWAYENGIIDEKLYNKILTSR